MILNLMFTKMTDLPPSFLFIPLTSFSYPGVPNVPLELFLTLMKMFSAFHIEHDVDFWHNIFRNYPLTPILFIIFLKN